MERALAGWTASLSLANPYLDSRGIRNETAKAFNLGVVASAEPPYEKFVGRLAIPYVDRIGPVGFTFRCIADHDCKQEGCPKYLQMDGQEVGFFNVLSLDSDEEVAHICEGELDAITLSQVVSGPVVAVSGVGKWKPHFPYHFSGFERVVVWADGDKAGKDMGIKIREHISSSDIVHMPAGEDVNSLFCSKGEHAVRALFEEDQDETAS